MVTDWTSTELDKISTLAGLISQPTRIDSPSPNITFNPLPTKSQSCSKLKMRIISTSQYTVAGNTITGRLELNCTSESVWLQEISVLLIGYEEVTGKAHQSKTFLKSINPFQGYRLPPSEAVHGRPKKDFYFQAKSGITKFEYSFDLPQGCPGSFEFQNMACLKYRLRALVRYEWKGKVDVLFKDLEHKVLQYWTQEDVENFNGSAEASGCKNVFMGEGEVHLSARIASKFALSGTNLQVDINVNNTSKKVIPGLKIEFLKRLYMIRPEADDEEKELKVVTKSASVFELNDREHRYEPDEHRMITVSVPVPVDNID